MDNFNKNTLYAFGHFLDWNPNSSIQNISDIVVIYGQAF